MPDRRTGLAADQAHFVLVASKVAQVVGDFGAVGKAVRESHRGQRLEPQALGHRRVNVKAQDLAEREHLHS